MENDPSESSAGVPARARLSPLLSVVAGPLASALVAILIVAGLTRRGWIAPAAGGLVGSIVAGVASALAISGIAFLVYRLRFRRDIASLGATVERVGRLEFGARAVCASSPELAEVAGALDVASRRIGRAFVELGARAELDRMMLAKFDVDRIAAALLGRVPLLVDCETSALAVITTGDGRPEGALYLTRAASGAAPLIRRFDLGLTEIVETKAIPAEAFIVEGQRQPLLASRLVESGVGALAVMPIEWNGSRVGVLLMGFRSGSIPAAEDLSRVRALVDPVGQALAGASSEEHLYANAHFDPLTGLPTRLLFLDRLDREVRRAQRDRTEFALLLCDLDRFGEMIRSYGETVAERMLSQIASRVAACIRESDSAARIRDDEFAVLLSDLSSPFDAGTLAESIARAVAQPITIDGRELFVTASIGIVLYPGDGADGAELLRHADVAMFRAKAAGRARAVFFEERMNREAAERLRAQGELRLAVERGELVLHFQPQVNLTTGEVVGAEALLRWRHPERGVVLPREFVPVAEQTGLINRIGYWVLDEVGRVIDGWRDQAVDAPRVLVNVSVRQFTDPAFVDAVRFSMQRWSLSRGSIGFEIPESALLDDAEAVARTLSQLKSLGAVIAIEDFGMRRSALSQLRRLPYDLIKIDRIFVREIARDTESASLVRAIVSIANQFGKQVVAEGIEADTQREFLRHHGCDIGQGILIGRPLPANEFLSYLVSQRLLRTSADHARRLTER